MEKYIAFDFGGTKIKHGIVNANGEILTKSDYQTERTNLDVFLNSLYQTIRTYLDQYEVQGIAISMPGYIDVFSGYAERAGAITALDGKNIKQLVEKEFLLPVEVENDGKCVALAEKGNGNATECNDFICMTIGTGIGGGIFLNGDIYRGSKGKAGEYGMMVNDFSGEKKDMHQTAAFSILMDEYKKLKGIEGSIEGTQIFEEIHTDPHVKELVDHWISHIARGIYNLTVTLNPEKVLIGGGVSAQSYLIEEINRQLTNFQYWHEFAIPVIRCKHQNDAGLIGAYYHFIRRKALRRN